MSTPQPIRSDSTSDILRDLCVLGIGTLSCAVLAIHFDWSEVLFAWTRRAEWFQLDELTFVLLSIAVGLAWFAARRWRGTRRELDARVALERQLAESLEEQRRLARQFVDAQEQERKRLSQELHDELGQLVNAMKLDAVAIRARAARDVRASSSELADRAQSIIANTDLVNESIARLLRELRPVGLDELGLSAALEHCVDLWRSRLEPAQLSLSVDEHIDALDEARTLAIYRTVQEALTNCARHAGASRVDIRIEWTAGTREGADQDAAALIRIEDDGCGTDLRARPLGLGLIGMRERLTALGGSLSVDSAPQTGFRLHARVPAIAARPAGT
ncbi:MAG TPA: sensor histidine kinase [Steroidobacteraceae bacterium]|nr:sensor histidine kinase [Steroidobacteraceae bacterium]